MKRKIKIERVSTWSIVTTIIVAVLFGFISFQIVTTIIVAVLFGFISFQSEREFHVLQTTTEPVSYTHLKRKKGIKPNL